MPRTTSQEMFAHVVDRPDDDIALDVAALLVGEWRYPDIEVARYLGQLDEFAARAHDILEHNRGRPCAALGALNMVLFGELGFRGNEDDYYDPRNSFLNEVIERRTGIPITMSVVYMEVARRIGADVRGVSFPGHFLTSYSEDGHTVLVDPFRLGMVLDVEALDQLAGGAGEASAVITPELLEGASKRQILLRILTNLAGIFSRGGEVVHALEVLERMHIVAPDNHRIEREIRRLRGLVIELN